MFANKAAIEHAFDLARSGECSCISDLTQRLDREGYHSKLKKQLTSLIDESKNAHIEHAADFSLDFDDGELRRNRHVTPGNRIVPQTERPGPSLKK
ncbi:MAG: hypothetical protein U1E25_14065 [Methylocystis sp.]